MNVLFEKRIVRENLRQLHRYGEQSYALLQRWPWLDTVDAMRAATDQAIEGLPAGLVRINVLHRWAYTTVLQLRADHANVTIIARLYHDAKSAEVAEVQVTKEAEHQRTLLLGAANSMKEKMYWNRFFTTWLAAMKPHLKMVSSL